MYTFKTIGIPMEHKKFQFTDIEINKMARRFKILSEPSRLKILRSLHSGEKCVTDIIESTGLLQANVSKQLRILEEDNIVVCRPQGLQRFYRIVDTTIAGICSKVCSTEK